MTNRMQEQCVAPSLLRVSVACFRWNGEEIETIVDDESNLPSAVPAMDETLDQAADRIALTHVARPPAYIEQLYTFDSLTDDCRETNITYLALFPSAADGVSNWMTAKYLTHFPDQTAQMLEYAIIRLQAKLEYTSIVFHLMPRTFTLAALQFAYESILGSKLDKRNFRRRMTTTGMLEATGEKRREGPHRPAALYRYSGQADHSSYLTPESLAPSGWQE